MKERTRVLVSIAHYLPGLKFGGPISTIANLVEHLGDEFDFHILTSDHDYRQGTPYPGIVRDEWVTVGKSQVFYSSAKYIDPFGIAKTIAKVEYDILYLNSFFHPEFTIAPLIARRMGLLPHKPCVLAPRGELALAALAIRGVKKRAYIELVRTLKIYSGLRWQASSNFEAEDIGRVMGRDAGEVVIAANLPKTTRAPHFRSDAPKSGNGLRVVLLARISQMKNVEFALEVIKNSPIPIEFDIWGTIESQEYWVRCHNIIAQMPVHVRVNYCGEALRQDVERTLSEYDIMFMPSLGENYGHVIAEALAVGTPVLISDRTPWRNLAREGVGWDIALEGGVVPFVEALVEAHRRKQVDGIGWRCVVLDYANRTLVDPSVVSANRVLFSDDTFENCSTRGNRISSP